MPTFLITAPDGSEFEVDGPEGATEEQALARVKAQYQGAPSGLSGTTAPDTRGEFSKGVTSGIDNMQGMAYGFAGLLGDSIGHEGLKNWGLENFQRNQQEAATSAPRIGSFTDIKDTGDFFDYTASVLGQTAPFSLTTIGGGGVGGLIAQSIGKRMLAKGISEKLTAEAVKRVLADPVKKAALNQLVKRGALTGSFATSAATQQGGLYAELKDAGVDDAALPAWIGGSVMGALDIAPEAFLLNKIFKPGKVGAELNEAISRGVKGKVKEIGKTAGQQTVLEGLTEGMQETTAILSRAASDENFDWNSDESRKRVLDSVVAGGIAGLFLGAGGGAVSELIGRKEAEGAGTEAGRSGAGGSRAGEVRGATADLRASAGAGVAGAAGQAGPGSVLGGAPQAGAEVAAGGPVPDQPVPPAGVAPVSAPVGGAGVRPVPDQAAAGVVDLQSQAQPAPAAPQAAAPAQAPAQSAGPQAPAVEPSRSTSQPTAEPLSDIEAQLRATRNPKSPRRATYLSAPSIAAHGETISGLLGGLTPVENADGNGGVLYAKLADAKEFAQRKAAGENVDVLLGEFTGADPLGLGGKPQSDNLAVVQAKDEKGAVVQETLVDRNKPAQVVQAGEALAASGTVEVTSPEAALQRRAETIAAEAPAPQAIEPQATESTVAEAGLFSQLSPQALGAWLDKFGATIYDQTDDSASVLQLRTKFLRWVLNDASKEQREAVKAWKDSTQFDLSLNPADDTLLRQLDNELPSAYKAKALAWINAKRGRISEIRKAKQQRQMPLEAVVRRVLELSHDKATADVYSHTKRAQHSEQQAAELREYERKAREFRNLLRQELGDEVTEEQQFADGLTGMEDSRPAFIVGKGEGTEEGVIHNQRVYGKGLVGAAPWVGEDAEDRAVNAAAVRQLQDGEATYTAKHLTKEEAKKLELPAAGWYVLAYPRLASELHYSKAAGGMRTPVALTRQFIANARKHWHGMSQAQKDPAPGDPILGVHFTKYDEDGQVVGVETLAVDEIRDLGLALDPSLNNRDINTKHRLEAALRAGLTAIMDFTDTKGARLRVTALDSKRGLPADLALRQEGKHGAQILLRDAVGNQRLLDSGVYTSRSARGRTMGAIKGPSAEPKPSDSVPLFDRSGSTAAQSLIYDEDKAEFVPYVIGEDNEIVPTEPENMPDTRQFETEEVQNRRGSASFDPADTAGESSRRGDSAIGVVGAPRLQGNNPAVAPTAAPTDPNAMATVRLPVRRGGEARGETDVTLPLVEATRGHMVPGEAELSEASPAPPIDPTREIDKTNLPERDAPVYASLPKHPLGRAYADVARTLRSLLKLRGRIVLVDNLADALRVASANGIDPNAIESQWNRILNRKAFGGVRQFGDTHFVILNPEAGTAVDKFKTLAHEIGHAFYNEVYADAPTELREALGEAYRRFMDTPTGQHFAKNHPQRYPIEEWIADQVAAWAYTDRAPRSALEKFFHKIAVALTQVYETMKARGYQLDQTAQMYIQYAIANRPDNGATRERTVDPSFDSLGDANGLYFETNMDPPPPQTWQQQAWAKYRAFKLKYPTLGKMSDAVGETMLAVHNSFLARVFKRVERIAPNPNHPFRRIMREFYTAVGENLSGRAGGAASFYSDMDGRMQGYTSRYRRILDGLSERDKTELMNEALRERPINAQWTLAPQLTQLRELLTEIRAYMLAAGLPIREVQNYFPQVYDKDTLADPAAIAEITTALARNDVINPVTGQPYTEDQVTSLMGNMLEDNYAVEFSPEAQIEPEGNDAPFAMAMRARKFPEQFRDTVRTILDSNGRPKYMSKSIDSVVTTYIRQSTMRAEYNRRFGDIDWADRVAMWEALPDRLRANSLKPQFDPQRQFKQMMSEAKTQFGATADDASFMYDVMSAMLGQYQRIQNPALRKLTNAMMLYQNMRTLLFVVFASFPDLANVFIRTGEFKDTFRSMKAVAKKALKGEMNDVLRAYGHAADSFDNTIMRELMDARDSGSKIWKWNEQWFRFTQITRWTNFVRGMGLNVSQDYVVKHAERVLHGHPEAADSQRRLDELGVSAAEVQAWAEHKRSYFEENGPQDEASRKVTAAIQRMVNDMVIHPTPPEKTLWGNSEVMKLVWHLKSFMYGFSTRVLGRAYHEFTRDGATGAQRMVTASALLMLLPLAAFGLFLRDILQYWMWGRDSYTPYDEPLKYLGVLAGRSGVTGVGQMAVDTFMASSRGRAPILATAGPTITWMNDWLEYPLYKTVPSAVPVLSSLPGARDAIRDWIKEE